MRNVYLDHNATTPVDKEVLDAMLPYFSGTFGNASSVHAYGRAAHKALDRARMAVAALVGAKDPDEIVFTSGGTEADNFALIGVLNALKAKGNHIITSQIEHSAVLNTSKHLEKTGAARVTFLPVDKYGIVDVEALKAALTDSTVLVSIMYANNEVGTIEPVNEIGSIVKGRGVCFHTDAVQAIGKVQIDLQKDPIDLMSMSAHKIYGPKGIGAIYIRKGTKISPIIIGGYHEKNRRAGTENVAGMVGFGKACEIAGRDFKKNVAHLTSLRDRIYEGISKTIPDVKLNGHPTQRLANTANISFEYLEGESILLNLDMEGVAVSTGSACTSGSLEPSHVLTAMGLEPQTAQGSLRFSLGKDNTQEDIDYVIKILPPIIQRLREMSPLYEGKK